MKRWRTKQVQSSDRLESDISHLRSSAFIPPESGVVSISFSHSHLTAVLLLAVLCTPGFLPKALAGEVVLAWNANSETNLGGYFLYYGTAPRQYSTRINVGNTTTYTVSDLANGTYYFSLTAFNLAGRESQYSGEVSETVGVSDTQPPVIGGVATASVSDLAATIVWDTDEPADTQVEYGTSSNYGSLTVLGSTMATFHSVELAGLAPSTMYHYRVLSRDIAGNLAVSGDFTFRTCPAPDTTPPVISSVQTSTVTDNSAIVTWVTNEPADAQVEYGLSTAYDLKTGITSTLSTAHSVTLTGLTAGSVYHYRVMSADAAGNLAVSEDNAFATKSNVDVTSGLVAAYSFDEGTGAIAADSSASSNFATIKGASWTTRARFGKALSFNGKNSYVSGETSGLPGVNDLKTIMCWLYLNGSVRTTQSVIVLANEAQRASIQHGFKGSTVGYLQFGETWLVAANPPASKTWHHFAYTFDGNRHNLFIDGVLASSSTITPQVGPATSFQIGRWVGGTEYFKGTIDEVRIYSRALSQEEIRTVMNTPISGAQASHPALVILPDVEDDSGSEEFSAPASSGDPVLEEDTGAQTDVQCEIRLHLSKGSYIPGETVSTSALWIRNPSQHDQIVELKAWLSASDLAPIPVENLSVSGIFTLPARFDQNLGSVTLFEVPDDLTNGSYLLGLRMISPVTGDVLFEDFAAFTVSTKKRVAAPAMETLPACDPYLSMALQPDPVDSEPTKSGHVPGLRILNASITTVPIEVKIWLETDTRNPIQLFSLGEDESVSLPGGSSLSIYQSVCVASAPCPSPNGMFRLRSRVLEPRTGKIIHEIDSDLLIR